MALNMTQRYTTTEVWEVGSQVVPGKAILGLNNKPGVTITGSGDLTGTVTTGPYTTTGPIGAPGLKPTKSTVAVNGAFAFPVAGASSTTPGNTFVYITAGGALSLTSGGNTFFGRIDRVIAETGPTQASVWIGA